jgi:hypothetical protein
MANFSDGRAIDVLAPKDITKDDFLHVSGWNGIALETKNSGEYLAMEVASDRLHWITLPAGITTAKQGDIIYVDTAGVLTTTSTNHMPALKVLVNEDSARICGARVLNVDIAPTA